MCWLKEEREVLSITLYCAGRKEKDCYSLSHCIVIENVVIIISVYHLHHTLLIFITLMYFSLYFVVPVMSSVVPYSFSFISSSSLSLLPLHLFVFFFCCHIDVLSYLHVLLLLSCSVPFFFPTVTYGSIWKVNLREQSRRIYNQQSNWNS